MSSINSVRNLQIFYFSKKNKEIKNLKTGEKKWPDIGIYTYYCLGPLPPLAPTRLYYLCQPQFLKISHIPSLPIRHC